MCGRERGLDRQEVFPPADQWASADAIVVNDDRVFATVNRGAAVLGKHRVLRAYDGEGELVWEHDGADEELGRALTTTPDGGVVICDRRQGVGTRLTRFTANGDVVWSNTGPVDCNGIAVTRSGLIAVGGEGEIFTFDADGEPRDSWIIRHVSWIKDIVADGDSLVVLLTYTHNFTIERYREDGEFEWAQPIGLGRVTTGASSITVAGDAGGIVVAGWIEHPFSGVRRQSALWRLSADGEQLWTTEEDAFDGVSGHFSHVVADPDGQLLVVGSAGDPVNGMFVAGYSAQGERQWWDGGPSAEFGHGHALALDSCGSVYVAGTMEQEGRIARYTPPD